MARWEGPAGPFHTEGDIMRIAITSQNFRTVTGHAGRAGRFLVFEAAATRAAATAETG
jgi:hypothetical protein